MGAEVTRILATTLVISAWAGSATLLAQTSASPPTPPAYKQLRYDEDYGYLRDRAKQSDLFDAIKFVRLEAEGDRYLSLGGEIRQRYEYFHNPVWGQEENDPERVLVAALHAACRPYTTPSSSGLVWPVSGPVVSGFGWRWGRMHEGIDIAVGGGTPIVAAAAGVVIYAGWMGGYGNLIIIDHGGGLATAYAHQSSFAVGGGPVGQGQTIGYVGCTGHCFGDHLHFEVRVNGAPVDPLGYL